MWPAISLVIVLLAVILALYWYRSRPVNTARVPESKPPSLPQTPRYWGMDVVAPSPDAGCKAMQQLQGKQFKLDEAPPLPLPNCTQRPDCQCRYQYLPERRSRKDRRSGEDRREAIRITSERRSGEDRRYDSGTWRDIDSV